MDDLPVVRVCFDGEESGWVFVGSARASGEKNALSLLEVEAA
jgi:hypothetical protein